MAAEETKQFSITIDKGGNAVAITCNTSQDMAGSQMINATQTIATAGTGTLDLGAVTPAGATLVVKNLDATNFVTLGLASGVAAPFAQIPPLDFFKGVIPAGVAAIYAKADTAAVLVAIVARDA